MKLLITILLLSISISSFSQQEPFYSVFWNNYSLYNPANTGVNYKHYAAVNGNHIFTNIDYGISTVSANYEVQVKKLHGGIGIGYVFDQLGIEKNNKVYLNYAFHTKLKAGTLSFGVSGMYFHRKLDYPPYIYHTCVPSIRPHYNKQGKFNINAGAYFKNEKLEIGLSSTQTNEAYYDKILFTNKRHYFALSSYKFNLNSTLELKPSIYVKSDIAYTQVTINGLLTYDKKYWTGISFTQTDAIGFQIGADIHSKFRIGYALDYFYNRIFFTTNHEIVLAFMLK